MAGGHPTDEGGKPEKALRWGIHLNKSAIIRTLTTTSIRTMTNIYQHWWYQKQTSTTWTAPKVVINDFNNISNSSPMSNTYLQMARKAVGCLTRLAVATLRDSARMTWRWPIGRQLAKRSTSMSTERWVSGSNFQIKAGNVSVEWYSLSIQVKTYKSDTICQINPPKVNLLD